MINIIKPKRYKTLVINESHIKKRWIYKCVTSNILNDCNWSVIFREALGHNLCY